MADQRPTFRFRLPWLIAGAAPRPATPVETRIPAQPITTTTTPTPTVETRAPAQPTTTTPALTTPAQRPPFRPSGLTPTQPPPPQAQALPRIESQPPSPSRTGTRFRIFSQPSSPSRATTQSQAASQPSSPSRTVIQSRTASQPSSPSRAAPQSRTASQPSSPSRAALQSRTASQPLSPSRTAPQPQPIPETTSQTLSPSRLASQSAGRTSSLPFLSTDTRVQTTAQEITLPRPPPDSIEPPTPVSKEAAEPQPRTQEPQTKTEIISDTVSTSQDRTSLETTIQPNVVAAQPSEVSDLVAATAPTPIPTLKQKSDSSTINADSEALRKAEGKPEEAKEVKEVEGKTNAIANEEPKQTLTELITATLDTKPQTKEQPNIAFPAEERQIEKQETLSTKETLATSGYNGTRHKTMIAHTRDKSSVGVSRSKPAISNGERAPPHKEIRDGISKFVHKITAGHPNHLTDEKPVSVITLAGENRGASMQLSSESSKREGTVHIHRGYRINPDESTEATTDGEGSSSGQKSNNSKTKEDQATKTYVNSNIQGINNSIMFNSSVTERNPGVHLGLSHNPTEPIKLTNRRESLETRKAEFNITPAQKLTYEPTIRRRCLRGLFMEPSDSDQDNPEKPRHHGCRYGYSLNVRYLPLHYQSSLFFFSFHPKH